MQECTILVLTVYFYITSGHITVHWKGVADYVYSTFLSVKHFQSVVLRQLCTMYVCSTCALVACTAGEGHGEC